MILVVEPQPTAPCVICGDPQFGGTSHKVNGKPVCSYHYERWLRILNDNERERFLEWLAREQPMHNKADAEVRNIVAARWWNSRNGVAPT